MPSKNSHQSHPKKKTSSSNCTLPANQPTHTNQTRQSHRSDNIKHNPKPLHKKKTEKKKKRSNLFIAGSAEGSLVGSAEEDGGRALANVAKGPHLSPSTSHPPPTPYKQMQKADETSTTTEQQPSNQSENDLCINKCRQQRSSLSCRCLAGEEAAAAAAAGEAWGEVEQVWGNPGHSLGYLYSFCNTTHATVGDTNYTPALCYYFLSCHSCVCCTKLLINICQPRLLFCILICLLWALTHKYKYKYKCVLPSTHLKTHDSTLFNYVN